VSTFRCAFGLKIHMKLNRAIYVEMGGNCAKQEPAQAAV
jgi:hypothetical protein